jgi:hypothetical protein
MCSALEAHPLSELEAILEVAYRHLRMALSFDESEEVSETLLPTFGTYFPAPTGDGLEPLRSLRVEALSPLSHSLCSDPRAEFETVLHMS